MLRNLLKIGLLGGVVYGAYKLGESSSKNKEKYEEKNAKDELDWEIELVEQMIEDYKNTPNKTQDQWDKKQLLEIRLEQLKQKR